jgi:hypothetical protein
VEAVNGNITSQLETINRTATYVYLNDAYESQESAFWKEYRAANVRKDVYSTILRVITGIHGLCPGPVSRTA